MTNPDATGYSLRDAVQEAIVEGQALSALARASVARCGTLEGLLTRAMLALCEHGDTRRSSALVREIYEALQEP